jgi:peptidoglycan/LPS O-acetylase OafA/YrhL
MKKSTTFRFSETTSVNLDLLRIYAFQTVCIGHGLGLVLDLQIAIEIGKTSIIVFFMLSGLLTTFSLFNKKNKENYDFKKYFVNRTSRIYPTLIVSLILVVIIDGIWATFNELDKSIYSYNIQSFLSSLFLVNETIFGYPSFGSANPLWTLPMFWWSYLFLGWIILGNKTAKKKSTYFLLLAFFTFMIIATFCGPLYRETMFYNVEMLFIWVVGVFVFLFLNRFSRPINQNKQNKQDSSKMQQGSTILVEKTQLNFSKKVLSNPNTFGGMAGVLFIVALCNQLITLDTYNTVHILLVSLSLFFLLIFSQYTNFKFNSKVKKISRFFSGYSFTLYLLHLPVYHFLMPFKDELSGFIVFILGYILSNLLSLVVASFTEKKAGVIERYLLKKLNLK